MLPVNGQYWLRHVRPDWTEEFALSIDEEVKTLFNTYAVISTGSFLLVSICLFMVLVFEFEVKINTFNGILCSIFHIVITMSSVGYGDYSPLSFFG